MNFGWFADPKPSEPLPLAGSFLFIDFCLIFVPFGHYDEPEFLPYENPSVCPKGADVRQHKICDAYGLTGQCGISPVKRKRPGQETEILEVVADKCHRFNPVGR